MVTTGRMKPVQCRLLGEGVENVNSTADMRFGRRRRLAHITSHFFPITLLYTHWQYKEVTMAVASTRTNLLTDIVHQGETTEPKPVVARQTIW